MADGIEAQAAQWYAAQDQDGMDWDGFTAWLESDPRHRVAFDAVALVGASLDSHREEIAARLDRIAIEEPVATNDNEASPSRRGWYFAGAGSAAALALTLAIGPWGTPTPVLYESGRGESRVIALEDGSRITLAPSSRLEVSGPSQTELALEGGAYFDVPHRPDRALTVRSGAIAVTDIGTRFSIVSDAGLARVEVAEGKVTVASARFASPVTLEGGHGLIADLPAGSVRLRALDPQSVGSWRVGQLRYADAPLALVAADISRYAGKPVTIDPALRGRSFSGVLTIGDGSTLASTLGAIIGVDVQEDARGIRFSRRA